MSAPQKIAVLLMTHVFNDTIAALFRRLRAESPPEYDLFMIVNRKDQTEVLYDEAITRERVFYTCEADMLAMPYPGRVKPWDGIKWTLQGQEDLNFLLFWQAHPDYDQYWGVEYDVHYEGNWNFLFQRFAESGSDLIATSLYHASETPHKTFHVPYLEPDGTPAKLEETIRGFYPLFRISAAACRAIDAEYRRGWQGHYEFLWGTLVDRAGLQIEDFGGNGPYVKPQNRNSFYFHTRGTYTLSPGNFVFRPVMRKAMHKPNTIWHPIKPLGVQSWHSDYQGRDLKALYYKLKPHLWRLALHAWFAFVWRPAR